MWLALLALACFAGTEDRVALGRGTVEGPGCAATFRHGMDSTMGTLACDGATLAFDLGQMSGTRVHPAMLAGCTWTSSRALPGARTRLACVRPSEQGPELVVTISGLSAGRALPANFWGPAGDEADRARLLAVLDTYEPAGPDTLNVAIPRGIELRPAGMEQRLRLSADADLTTVEATPGLQLGVAISWTRGGGEPAQTDARCDLRAPEAWGPVAETAEGWRAELVYFETAVGCAERWVYTVDGYRRLAEVTISGP